MLLGNPQVERKDGTQKNALFASPAVDPSKSLLHLVTIYLLLATSLSLMLTVVPLVNYYNSNC